MLKIRSGQVITVRSISIDKMWPLLLKVPKIAEYDFQYNGEY